MVIAEESDIDEVESVVRWIDSSKGERQNIIYEGFSLGTYLVGRNFERFPVYPRKNVPQKGRIVLNVRLLKLGVFETEGKGKGRSLACFDGTRQEVYC